MTNCDRASSIISILFRVPVLESAFWSDTFEDFGRFRTVFGWLSDNVERSRHHGFHYRRRHPHCFLSGGGIPNLNNGNDQNDRTNRFQIALNGLSVIAQFPLFVFTLFIDRSLKYKELLLSKV